MEEMSQQVLEELGRMNLAQRRAFLAQQKYPELVYKYRSLSTPTDLERVRQILLEHSLWLSPRSAFNDPFDGRFRITAEGSAWHRIRKLKTMLKQFKPGLPRRELERAALKYQSQLTAEHAGRSAHTVMEQLGVCSFGTEPDNLLMWSHYGGSHGGVALGFDVAEGWDPLGRLQKIKYEPEYVTINYLKDGSHIQSGLKDALFRKSPEWRYENESRIVIVDGARSALRIRFPECLRVVVYGCGISDDARYKIQSFLKDRTAQGHRQVEELQAMRQADRYTLKLLSWDAQMPRQEDGFY